MILVDPRNPTAAPLEARLRADLPSLVDDDLVVVVGGDGFMLHTVAAHGLDRTYLGLNAGRIGFLLNDIDDWASVVDRLTRRAWTEYGFRILEAEVTQTDGTTTRVRALNDVALERGTGQTAHLAVTIDGTPVVDTLVADGLIFSTALGSTAYAFSAGGPACHPTLDMIGVTAVCAHHPRLSPFLLPPTATAHVDVIAAHRRPVRAVADGTAIDDVVAVDVRAGEGQVRIAWLEGHDHTARMITKILRP